MGKLPLLAVLALSACAETYYVSPKGTPDGDGSAANPWPSVEYALSKVGSRQTIVLQAGFYPGIRIDAAFGGTPVAPTIIRAEQKWKAVIAGSTGHGVYIADKCTWVVIDGLEVNGSRQDGIKISGNNNVVRNCWVHGNNAMGISAHGMSNWAIENCLLEFNGQNPQFHHGIYADGLHFIVRNNIVRHNSGYGMQLYPGARDGVIANNLVYGQTRKCGMIVASPTGGGRNQVVNNTVADNACGISITKGLGEVIANNILVGDKPLTVDSNTGKIMADYNLCQPECTQGEHGRIGDPQFVYTTRGAYYLKSGSPAIGGGSPDYAPEADFWGRPRAKDTIPDMGAFPYLPYFASDESRSTWYSGYAYRYSPNKGQDMPDLWTLPDTLAVPAAALTVR